MKTEIISFYSDVDGTSYYTDCAKRLIGQLTELEVPFDIRPKESLGTYQKNCLSKPLYILSMLEEKKKPVIWLDVDSTVMATPEIFDTFEGNADIVVACAGPDIMSAKASPIYFAYNDKVKEFLSQWIDIARRLTEEEKWFDHEALLALINTLRQDSTYSIKFVGPEYCVWPGQENDSTIILMGLSDAESKKSKLREMGFNEEQIQWQSPGVK
jgi:hypothetical protein